MTTEPQQEELVEGTSLWKDAWHRLRKNKAAVTGALIVLIMALSAVFYEQIVRHGTRFTHEEQHSYVMPKPPGSFSVPSYHFRMMSADGAYSFDVIDVDDDGRITAEEIREAYRRWEFHRLDRSGSGTLTWQEYSRAPLSMKVDNVPSCERWEEIRMSRAPIDHPDVFACDADEHGELTYEKTGRLLDIVSIGEARDIIGRYDLGDKGYLTRDEFVGLPRPERNWLGTDQLGRDLLTRLIYGGRISLAVGLLATLVSFFIGVSWGATAGYVGGKVDNVMMRIVDVMYGLPFIFLVILLMVVFGRNIILLFIALGAVQWLTMARIVRGQVISLKSQEFVEAAQTIGVSKPAIIFRHLIPNALGPIIVYATLTVPAVMLEEAFLSFLGLGVQAPQTSWGALASEGRQVMEMAPWMIVFPGLALAITLLSLNFLGDGLRDALDPQLRKD
jgi:ABC-type dipeptide/oligopeptide/nickel transport system permease subunit